MNPEIAPILDVPEPPSLGAQGARLRYDHPGLEPLEKFGDILDTCTQGDGKRAENPAEELGWLATRSSRNCLRQPTFALLRYGGHPSPESRAKGGAGYGDRTRLTGLGSQDITTMLSPHA